MTGPNPADLSDDEDNVWLRAKRAKADHQKAVGDGRTQTRAARDAEVDNMTQSSLGEWSGKEDVPVDSADGASSEECSVLASEPLEDDSDGYMETDSECTNDDSASCDEPGSAADETGSDEVGSGDEAESDEVESGDEAESDEVGSGDEAEVMKQLAAIKRLSRHGQEKGKEERWVEGGAVGETEQGGLKYVPPGLRSMGDEEGRERVQLRLKKKLNGLVNRWVDLCRWLTYAFCQSLHLSAWSLVPQ